MKIMKMKINLPQLMHEAGNTCQTPAIVYGFQIANGCLNRIAQIACQIGNEEICQELETLGYVNINITENATVISAASEEGRKINHGK